MFQWFSQLFNLIKKCHKKSYPELLPEKEDRILSSSLKKNKKVIKEIFDRCDDLVIREFMIGRKKQVRAMAVFFEPLVNPDLLHHSLLHPLMSVEQIPLTEITVKWLEENIIPNGKIIEKNRWVEVTYHITTGLLGLFVEGQPSALLISALEENSRQIDQPTAETVIRGPADAFNEDLRKNIALLRKRLHTSRLAVEDLEVGEVTKTAVKLVYLKGYVMDGLVEEIKNRVRRIKVDGILGSGQIEEYIQDSPYSPFNHLDITERPDKLTAALLEGRAALIINNTPFCLIIPTTLTSQFQSPEDYYNRYWFASFIRLVRWLAALASLFLPSLYIAIITFHQELLPTPLLMSILVSREGIPFPALVEALIMDVIFEVLHEAGVRLPRAFGQTVSIVGAIVLGQAAVSAGLASAPMVIIISITAIASFTIPSIPLANTVRILRFPFMLAASSFGLLGVMALLLLLTFHLCSLRSFGVPYLSPLAPLSFSDLKDALVRAPAWMMLRRPQQTGYAEPKRQAAGLKPHPPLTREKVMSRGRRNG